MRRDDGARRKRRIETCCELIRIGRRLGQGLVALQRGDANEAVAVVQRAIELQEGVPEFHGNLGSAFSALRQWDDAIRCYRRAVELQRDYTDGWQNLGRVLKRLGRLEEAIGHLDEAIACYRQAIECRSEFVSLAELHAAHTAFETAHAAPLRTTWAKHANTHDPSRKLRIGFVSPDLRRHPVGHFLIPVLENIDCGECEIYCYSNDARRDDLTVRLRATATAWHHVWDRTDQELADQIRADRTSH